MALKLAGVNTAFTSAGLAAGRQATSSMAQAVRSSTSMTSSAPSSSKASAGITSLQAGTAGSVAGSPAVTPQQRQQQVAAAITASGMERYGQDVYEAAREVITSGGTVRQAFDVIEAAHSGIRPQTVSHPLPHLVQLPPPPPLNQLQIMQPQIQVAPAIESLPHTTPPVERIAPAAMSSFTPAAAARAAGGIRGLYVITNGGIKGMFVI